MKGDRIVCIGLVLVVLFSTYFAGVAYALTSLSGSLTLYRLDSTGNMVAATNNVFSAAQQIWAGIPIGAAAPYLITSFSASGRGIWSQNGTSLPSNNLLPIILAPSVFPPGSYQLVIQTRVQTSPGFYSPQTDSAIFSIVPAVGNLVLENYSHQNRTARAQVSLLDLDRSPLTGVRLGLILHQGNSSLQITSETTNSSGRSVFQVGEALAAGDYWFEVKILDSNALWAPSIRTPTFTVQTNPAFLQAWANNGMVTALLLRVDGQGPAQGRLLALETQLKDGNWTIVTTQYTDNTGQASFSSVPLGPWRVSFGGDQFYGPARSGATGIGSNVAPASSTTSPGSSTRSSPSSMTRVDISPQATCGPCACKPIGSSINIAADSGKSQVTPMCGGGGGGGGTPVGTTTTLFLPTTSYSIIPTVLTARVKDVNGNPVTGGSVQFYNASSYLIAIGMTNSTGYASVVWTPNTVGTTIVSAVYPGDSGHSASSTQGSLTINATPTTVEILKPSSIAFSWDLYNYYSGNGLPIVVPVNILVLALSGNGAPANIYMPPYNGSSTTPAPQTGYGWTGLNQTSAVTITFNSTYTQTQNMNWTRNFYLPPCSTPPNCSTTPRSGHMYLTVSLAPPNTLYSASSTSLNIPYQNVNSLSSASGQVTHSTTPPQHLYINLNATYPYISVKMQNLPVALAAYTAFLAYSLGGPLSSTISGGYTVYALPVPADFAQVCFDSGCNSPAGNVAVYLYNSSGQYCGVYAVTNNRGIGGLDLVGSKSTCTFPYYYAVVYTSGTTLRLTELFRTEAVSSPSPFYTNFQGYNYAIYAPQRTGRYLLHMFTFFLNSPYTVLYPSTSYPDVQYPYLNCCDIILNVEKHPVQVQATFNPGTTTILSKTNATITLTDLATNKPMSSTSFNYVVVQSNPGSGTVLSGTLTTNSTGYATLNIGLLPYGNYTLIVSMATTSTISAVSSSYSFTVFKAKPTLIISPGWIQNAIAGQTYTFTTSLVNNATSSLINVAGLSEKVYVNNVLFGTFGTNSGGNVTFSWTPTTAGQYTFQVNFPQQNYYTSSSITIMISVARRNVVLAVNSSPPSPKVGQSVTWNVYAYDMIDKTAVASMPASLFINGANTTTVSTNSTGYAVFTYTFSSQGAYNVTFVTATTSVYSSATTRNPMTVFMDTTVTLPGGTVILGQQNSLTVTLRDANGNPLPSRVIQIQINGASYANLTTNSAGQAQFIWQPRTTGNYTITASFSATGTSDTGYRPSSASIIVSIMPQTTTNTSSTSSGTQSITLSTAQGSAQPPPPSFSVSVSFPSLGWVNLNIQLNGRSLQGSLHVWNEFGASCVASVFGVCVMVAPWWHVHFDASSNLLSFSFITDFFTGTILSQFLTANAVWVDQSSGAFQTGQVTAQVLIGAATAAYVVGRVAEGGVDDSLGTTAAAAVWFGGATGAVLGDFLVYKDKQSELNFLGGMVAGFGLSVILKLFSITVISNLVSYAAWSAYWIAYEFADPYSKPVLFFSALTVVLAIGEIFELLSSM